MKNEIPQYFEIIKEYFLIQFSMFSDENLPIINTRVWDSIHSTKDDRFLKNYVIEIKIENLTVERELFLSYYEGFNANKTLSNCIAIGIKNISKTPISVRKNFSINDFCEFYNLEQPEPSFFETNGINYSIEKSKNYLDSVKFIIESSNLKKILKGEIWIDIPINMKPYK